MYNSFFKRWIDFILSVVILLLVSPVFVLVFLLLLFANRGKPFFFQARPGKHGDLFKIVKFRTMNDRRASNGELLPDHVRLTAVGAFIRKTSLDEIPQLLNVIKNDMSLVGPRPLLPEYLPLYSLQERKRHDVKPGITGWAQVNGRNAISWNQKFEYDVWYATHLSFSLDLKIILLTLKKVVKKDGISSGTSVTMEKFTGN